MLRTKPQSLGRTVQWRDQLQRLEAEMEEQSRLQEVCSSRGSGKTTVSGAVRRNILASPVSRPANA